MTDEYRIPDDMHDCGDETCPDYDFPTYAEPNREAPLMSTTHTPDFCGTAAAIVDYLDKGEYTAAFGAIHDHEATVEYRDQHGLVLALAHLVLETRTGTHHLDRYNAAKVKAAALAPRSPFVGAAELVRRFETHRGLDEETLVGAIRQFGADSLIAIHDQNLHREVANVHEWADAERERAVEGITSNLLEDDPTN